MQPIFRTALLTAVTVLAAGPSAWANHPTFEQMGTVSLLAHRVADAAEHVHHAAERTAHHGDWAEAQSLRDLHELAEAARHFHHQVEQYRRDFFHTEADFVRLFEAYEVAAYRIRDLHAFGHVQRDFYRLESAMNDLTGYYGVPRDRRDWRNEHGDPYGRRGRQGHGRFSFWWGRGGWR